VGSFERANDGGLVGVKVGVVGETEGSSDGFKVGVNVGSRVGDGVGGIVGGKTSTNGVTVNPVHVADAVCVES